MKSKKAMSVVFPALLGLAGSAAAQLSAAPAIPVADIKVLSLCTLPWPQPVPKPVPPPPCDGRGCDPLAGPGSIKDPTPEPKKPHIEQQSLTRFADLRGGDADKGAEILDALFTGAKSAFVRSAPVRAGNPLFRNVDYDPCFDSGKNCPTFPKPPAPPPTPRPEPRPAPNPQPAPPPLPPSPIPGTTRPA